MAATFSSVPVVLGILMSWGGVMLGDVFYTENKVNPTAPEVHPIHKNIERTVSADIIPTEVAPLSYNDGAEVKVIEGEGLEHIDDQDGALDEIDDDPTVISQDFTGGGSSEIKGEAEPEETNVIVIGKKKVSKTLTIGTIAGVIVLLAASCLPIGIVILLIKKRKAKKAVAA